MKYAILLVLAGFMAGGAYVGMKYQAYVDTKESHQLAITYGCGEYNRVSGEFNYIEAPQPDSIFMSEVNPPLPPPKPAKKAEKK